MIKIDVGSGRAKLDGYITVDKDPSVGADITADVMDWLLVKEKLKELIEFEHLDDGNNEIVEVRAHHFLEHIPAERKVEVMNSLWNLLGPGGILDIEVPLFPNPASVQDPTHLSFWTKESFWYFIKGNKFGEAFAKRYSEVEVPLMEFVEDWKRGDEKQPWAYGIKLRKI